MSSESGIRTSEYGFGLPIWLVVYSLNYALIYHGCISLNKGIISTLVLEDKLLSELQLLLSVARQPSIGSSPTAVQKGRGDAPTWDLVKESTQILRLHSYLWKSCLFVLLAT